MTGDLLNTNTWPFDMMHFFKKSEGQLASMRPNGWHRDKQIFGDQEGYKKGKGDFWKLSEPKIGREMKKTEH